VNIQREEKEKRVANLTAWKFDTVQGAEQASKVLEDASKRQLISIQDAAIVEWEEGKKKPKTKQLNSPGKSGAAMGGFWGMLFGLIFFVPLLGLAIGAGMGALMGHFADYGINDDFIKEVRNQVVPGTSALFLMSTSTAPDRVIEEVKAAGLHPTLIESNLTEEQEKNLNAAFAAE
jgi:uncharacterized membrane protein